MVKVEEDVKPHPKLVVAADAHQPSTETNPAERSDAGGSDYEPSTPKSKKRRASTASPTKTKTREAAKTKPSPTKINTGDLSPRGKYYLMAFEAGLAVLNKEDVASKTGLSASQQKDMTRRDKGSLWKTIEGVAAGL